MLMKLTVNVLRAITLTYVFRLCHVFAVFVLIPDKLTKYPYFVSHGVLYPK